MFGSSNCLQLGEMIRHCHGNEQWNCDFSFPEKDDDKYFYETDKEKNEQTNKSKRKHV